MLDPFKTTNQRNIQQSLDYLGYIGGMYGTLDGGLGFLGLYFSTSLLFSTFCQQVFVYRKKAESEGKKGKNVKVENCESKDQTKIIND